jgi:hypothetical protein
MLQKVFTLPINYIIDQTEYAQKETTCRVRKLLQTFACIQLANQKTDYHMVPSIYRHVIEWLQTGFGLVIEFTEHLQIVTISNYSTITNSHTLQFPTARTKSSQSAAFQQRTLLCSWAQVLTGWRLFHNWLIAPTVLLITSRHGTHKNTVPFCYSIVV